MKKTLSVLFAISLFSSEIVANEINHEEICPAFWEENMSGIHSLYRQAVSVKSQLGADTDQDAAAKIFEYLHNSPEILKEMSHSMAMPEDEVKAMFEVGEIVANEASTVFFDTKGNLHPEKRAEFFWNTQCHNGNFDEMINIVLNDDQ